MVVRTTSASMTTMMMRVICHKMVTFVILSTMMILISTIKLSTVEARAAILGIDLGSLYMKVALVQSGHPIEIVTNLHSKRKTEQMILFDGNQRFYGADAIALLQRKAHITPTAMNTMLGRNLLHPSIQVMSERHSPIVPTYNETRKGVMVQIGSDSTHLYTPEELVAMIFQHAVDISVAYAAEGGSIIPPPKDIVITVPSYSTIAERRAIYDASLLANTNILTMIDENTAAALHYAMDKNFEGENEQCILFYNLGASSLQISIIKFYNYDQPQKFGKPKSTPAIEVISKTWDITVGGNAFDHVIVEYLADEFNKIYHETTSDTKFDVRSNVRAMTKLRINANKIKHVLSANNNIPIYIDSVYNDISLQLKESFTRTQFETMCQDLIQRATVLPITKAIQMANLTSIHDLTGIELLGGGMRIPSIQAEIQKMLLVDTDNDKDKNSNNNKKKSDTNSTNTTKLTELGFHINSDESFALGAAFAGANISTAFRVRQVGMIDINPFSIGVTLSNLPEEGDSKPTKTVDNVDEEWNKSATIFKANGKMGVKKTIAFTHSKNIYCGLDYLDTTSASGSTTSNTLPPGTELPIVRYNITGIPEFIVDVQNKTKVMVNTTNTTTETSIIKPKISLQFELSTSGFVSLIKAEAVYEQIYTVQEEVEIEDDDTNATTTSTNSSNSTTGEVEKDTTSSSNDTLTNTTTSSNETILGENATTTTNTTVTKPKRTMLVDKIFGIRRTSPTFVADQRTMIMKEKKRVHKKLLTVDTYYEGSIQPYTEDLLLESRTKLGEMAQRDKDRMLLDEAKNKVESYIYKIKNKLSDDEENMEKFATEKERTNVQQLAEKAEDWLYDEGSSADLATMQAKYDELSIPFELILTRIRESIDRPKAIEDMNKKLTDIENLMVQWETSKPQVTQEERDNVLQLVDGVRKWIEEKEAKQSKVKEYEDPTYYAIEITGQLGPIEAMVVKLGRKPKPPKNETSTNSTTNSSSTSTEFNATSTNNTTTILENDDDATTTNETTTATASNDDTKSNNTNTTTTKDKDDMPVTGGSIDDEL